MEMQNPNLIRVKPSVSTQRFLDVAEIKDSIIILRDGSYRAAATVSSTNFALKSEEEQNALTAGYENFLNSLEFPVQILIHSRVLDINGYLEKLRNLASGQTNELLRIQMSEYIEYIAKLVEYSSIMSKIFYVVVSYSERAAKKEGFGGKFLKIFNPASGIATREEDFEKAKIKIEERVNHVMGGLGGVGLRSIRLNTSELMELLYQSYNLDNSSPLRAEALGEIDMEAETKQ